MGGSCEHGNKLWCSIKYWEILEYTDISGFSRRAQVHAVS
jgi:hypothetical protein